MLEYASPQEQTAFALQQYSAAVTSLRIQIDQRAGAVDVDVVLLICLLMSCFELLQTNVQSALIHLQKGLSILSEHYPKAVLNYACWQTDPSAPRRLVDDLVPALIRTDCVSCNFFVPVLTRLYESQS